MFTKDQKQVQCSFYIGKHIVEGSALRLSFSGVALQLKQAAQQLFNEGEAGECFINGRESSSCGFNCQVVSAGGESLILRFNPLNDDQIKFIRSLTTITC